MARRSGEPLLSLIGSWAVLGASFALSADTWILLAELAGFTRKLSIPDTDVTFALAWLMPICVDGYVVVALTLWMSPVPAKVARFAKVNTYVAASFGIAAQGLYHLLMTMSTASEDWQIFLAAVVGALPPALAGLTIHMRALIRRESNNTGQQTTPAPSKVAGLVSLIGQVRQAMTSIPTPTTPIPATVPDPTTAVPAAPANMPAATPTAPINHLSDVDTVSTRPAKTPEQTPVPTPDVVAPRIAPRHTEDTRQIAPAGATAGPVRHRTSMPKTPAKPLAPSSTDRQVNATEAVQLVLPMLSPARIQRARELAQQHHTEHGTPITAGTLAVRLRIPTEQATQLVAQLTTPASNPSVNGHEVTAA